MNLVDLICEAEQRKKSYEDSDYKARKKKARDQALVMLKSKVDIRFHVNNNIPRGGSDQSMNSLRKYRMGFG